MFLLFIQCILTGRGFLFSSKDELKFNSYLMHQKGSETSPSSISPGVERRVKFLFLFNDFIGRGISPIVDFSWC